MTDSRQSPFGTPWRFRSIIVAAGFLSIIAFFAATEHRAHAFGILPYLLVIVCPLMHLFMHGGHHGHHGGGNHGNKGGDRDAAASQQLGRQP